MKAQGELVRLYYDQDPADDRPVVDGDYIRTGTGRLYLVDSVRTQLRGKHAGTRRHLVCTVMDPEHPIEVDATVHPMVWYRR